MRFLVVTLLLSACTPSDPPVRIPKRTPPVPGAEGRSVLWIEPKPQHPLGALASADSPELSAIRSNPGETAEQVAKLRASLSSSSPRLRDAAISALAEATHDDAALSLLAASLDPHPVLRQDAVEHLLDLTAPTRDLLLDRALRGDEREAARGAAASWSRLVEDADEAGPRLVSLFHDVADPLAQAMMLAEQCGEVSPMLAAAAEASETPLVRAAARYCAAQRGPGSARVPSQDFVQALRAADAGTHAYAATLVEALHDRFEPAERTELLRALTGAYLRANGQGEAAIAAAQAALGDPEAVNTLAIRARTDSSDDRLRALAALARHAERAGTLEGAALAGALERAMEDDDATVREMAAQVAGWTRDGQVAGLLARLLIDPVAAVRFAAVYALARSGSDRAIGSLVELALEDRDPQVRDAGHAALHHLVHEHPLPPPSMISSWLDDPGEVGDKPFWGRDSLEWRAWYQSR